MDPATIPNQGCMLNTSQTERRSAGCDKNVVLWWIVSVLDGVARFFLSFLEPIGRASEAGLEMEATDVGTPRPVHY